MNCSFPVYVYPNGLSDGFPLGKLRLSFFPSFFLRYVVLNLAHIFNIDLIRCRNMFDRHHFFLISRSLCSPVPKDGTTKWIYNGGKQQQQQHQPSSLVPDIWKVEEFAADADHDKPEPSREYHHHDWSRCPSNTNTRYLPRPSPRPSGCCCETGFLAV